MKTLVYTKQVGCEQRSDRAVWPVGQGVKTSPSHGENTGSIPVLAALMKFCILESNLHIRSVECENEESAEQRGQLVKGLRRRPLTAKTRVRFPYWLLKNNQSFL